MILYKVYIVVSYLNTEHHREIKEIIYSRCHFFISLRGWVGSLGIIRANPVPEGFLTSILFSQADIGKNVWATAWRRNLISMNIRFVVYAQLNFIAIKYATFIFDTRHTGSLWTFLGERSAINLRVINERE